MGLLMLTRSTLWPWSLSGASPVEHHRPAVQEPPRLGAKQFIMSAIALENREAVAPTGGLRAKSRSSTCWAASGSLNAMYAGAGCAGGRSVPLASYEARPADDLLRVAGDAEVAGNGDQDVRRSPAAASTSS